MKNMTFSDYDALVAKIVEIDNEGASYWPSIEEIKEKATDINNHITFFIFLLEKNDKPVTMEEKESEKYIRKLLYENLNLYSDDD